MDLISVLTKAGIDAAAGLTYAFTGYAKAKGEKMDWRKFITTGALGAMVGIGAEFTSMPFATIETYMGTFGITAAVENIIKTVWRRILGH